MHKIISLFYIVIFFIISKIALAETIQINFTGNDSYSIEVAHIDVGDTIEWYPDDDGHNVEFLAGPNMNSLPAKSKLNAFHSVVFEIPGVYLYQCTPHGNSGMIGLVIVGNNFDNLEDIKKIPLSRATTSVLERLVRIAVSK
ncbi:plastocyanin/azurin family copper-binding protein [Paracoccaceae bacterium]|nr:plastocyanin/azurin family copper-binding protein [Paracoccaceae bacterium]|tara:strand:+ start:167 stop:592 length:426 start_codon:yes stop_codon:yes gene_type:complete